MKITTLRVDQEGLQSVLGSLEAEVMSCLWEVGMPATNKRIHRELRKRGILREYTTLAVVTKRLTRKGFLKEVRTPSGAYTYVPIVTEDELIDCTITKVLHRLLADWPERLQTFIEVSQAVGS